MANLCLDCIGAILRTCALLVSDLILCVFCRRRRPRPPTPKAPSTWHGLKPVFLEIHRYFRTKKQQARPHEHDPKAFPILRLPREVRDMIYDHVQVLSISQAKPARAISIHCSSHRNELDSSSKKSYTINPPTYEDVVREKYHPDPVRLDLAINTGFLSYYRVVPTKNLLLVCKQFHDEVLAAYPLAGAFEVSPLTPHAEEWRFDPTYDNLSNSSHLPNVRKILLRIDLARMQIQPTPRDVGRSLHGSNTGPIKWEEINLETCISKIQPLAKKLARVLQNRAKRLEVLIIDFKDDFHENTDWGLKKSVLAPFRTLSGAQIQLGKLIVAKSGRASVKQMLDETLEEISTRG